MAIQFENHQQNIHASSSFNSLRGETLNNKSSTRVIPGQVLGLKHNQDISLDWTQEELAVLEQGLVQFALEYPLRKYTLIAVQLRDKTIRDIALRVRWMTKKENGKRRKDDNLTRKARDKKERVSHPSSNSSYFAPRTNRGISYKGFHPLIAGPARELLNKNEQALDQISRNLATCRAWENIDLFDQIRTNFLEIVNGLNDEPEKMKTMPPLTV